MEKKLYATIAAWYILLLGIMAFALGCESPESFDLAKASAQCEVTNPYSITESYECQDGTYRCTNADGSTKYKDCTYGTIYCVEVCR